ncbi:MAG TPA: cytochrome c [Thermoanaerobaculia bacterium]|nr:cytochrome c [Thermoanaerobaculia bacterium]
MRKTALVFAALVAAGALGACRQDMHDQPKYEAYEASRFFRDGTSARPLPPGTVARGHLREDEPYYTGYTRDDRLVRTIPVEVDRRTLERGRETYDAFCAPCHDRAGSGRGMIVRRGFKQPPTYHQDRLRNEMDGYFFDVITNGFGQMPSYAHQISVEDRWAVVAYVRALQLSQHAALAELPPEDAARARSAGAVGETGGAAATGRAAGREGGH